MMRKFLGLSTPKKRPLIGAKEINKAYDQNKRHRTLVPGWKIEFKWLTKHMGSCIVNNVRGV